MHTNSGSSHMVALPPAYVTANAKHASQKFSLKKENLVALGVSGESLCLALW